MILYWLAHNNFFNKPTSIRFLQCAVFGHGEVYYSNGIKQYSCTWCGCRTGAKYKQKKRSEMKDFLLFSQYGGFYWGNVFRRLVYLWKVRGDLSRLSVYANQSWNKAIRAGFLEDENG